MPVYVHLWVWMCLCVNCQFVKLGCLRESWSSREAKQEARRLDGDSSVVVVVVGTCITHCRIFLVRKVQQIFLTPPLPAQY